MFFQISKKLGGKVISLDLGRERKREKEKERKRDKEKERGW